MTLRTASAEPTTRIGSDSHRPQPPSPPGPIHFGVVYDSVTDNVLVSIVPVPTLYGYNGGNVPGLEFWGTGQANLMQSSTVLSRREHCWTVVPPRQDVPHPVSSGPTARFKPTQEDEREGQSEAWCTKDYLAQSEAMIVNAALFKP